MWRNSRPSSTSSADVTALNVARCPAELPGKRTFAHDCAHLQLVLARALGQVVERHVTVRVTWEDQPLTLRRRATGNLMM